MILKLIEKAVANQLNSYINKEGLSNLNQSAYKRLHSTETALLKIQNNIAASMDSGKAVALTLLDLSAAFDTIDHTILFNCLRDWFGVDGTVLMWIKSYLTNRRQKVKLGNSFSDAFSLPYGVPQGSVLGPLLFTLYTTPLSHIISSFNVTHHLYADDTQIYFSWHLIPGTLIPVLLSSLSVLRVFKNGWMVSDGNLIQRRQNLSSLATDRPGSQSCKNFPSSFLENQSPPLMKLRI